VAAATDSVLFFLDFFSDDTGAGDSEKGIAASFSGGEIVGKDRGSGL
jgi:hypothetical protein